MSKTKKLIKEQGIIFKELWDKPSKKGTPTKDSILITIAIMTNVDGMSYGGYSVKMSNDEHKQKVGRAIAVRNLHDGIFDIDIDNPEKHTINYFECKPYLGQFSNKIRDRIKFICGIREGLIVIKLTN